MNVYQTIDELFAQAAQHFQDPSKITIDNIANIMQELKKQVVCTIAIGNQLEVSNIVHSLQSIPFNNNSIYCEPK